MPDLTSLRELTTAVRPPDLDELASVARRRRAQTALGLAGLAVAAVLMATVAAPGLDRGSEEPVDVPKPTRTDRPDKVSDWTPELIRAHAETSTDFDTRDGLGPTARVYTVCVGRDCGNGMFSRDDDRVLLGALEVSDPASGASRLLEFNPPWHPGNQTVIDLGEMLLVSDAPVPDAIEKWRYRLVGTTSTVDLTVVRDPVPAHPGPDVLDLPQVESRAGGLVSLDEEAGTITVLDVPREVRWWGPDLERELWGIQDVGSRGPKGRCAVWWLGADGGFKHHDLDCANPSLGIPDLEANGLPPLEPGHMAVLEYGHEGTARAVHVSTDGGQSWRRLEVEASRTDAYGEALQLLADAL